MPATKQMASFRWSPSPLAGFIYHHPAPECKQHILDASERRAPLLQRTDSLAHTIRGILPERLQIEVTLVAKGVIHAKFALAGLTEAFWQELEPLGLNAMLVELGGFRTGVAQRTKSSASIEAYSQTAGAVRQYIQNMTDESIPGGPDRAAQATLNVIDENKQILRLVLGSDAFTAITKKGWFSEAGICSFGSNRRSTDYGPTG